MQLVSATGEPLVLRDEPALRGGESCVYRASDATGRALAVKVALLPTPFGAWLDAERALLEQLAADPTTAPHVVPVRHHGSWGDRPFFAMDWFPDTLATFIPRANADQRHAAAVRVCEAVAALHAARPDLVHRDLKPTNLLLEGDAVRLADFGTSRVCRPGATTTTAAYFSPGWAPPEQTLPREHRPERSWDVYSLAATVFFALVGEAPESPALAARCLTREGVRQVAGAPWLDFDAMVALTPGDRRKAKAAGVPPAVVKALAAALAPRPEDRRGSATSLAAVLRSPPTPGGVPTRRIALVGLACVTAVLALSFRPTEGSYAVVRVAPPAESGVQRPFDFGVAEVTQAQWREVMGEDPARRRRMASGSPGALCTAYEGVSLVGDDLPMTCVSFLDAIQFANALSQQSGLTPAYTVKESPGIGVPEVVWDEGADGWRLPTDAEWLVTAGAESAGNWPPEGTDACKMGNVADRTVAPAFARFPDFTPVPCDDGFAGLSPASAFPANTLGVRDLHGNVAEWVWTPEAPGKRPFRGPSWMDALPGGRLVGGGELFPTDRHVLTGVRLARSPQ